MQHFVFRWFVTTFAVFVAAPVVGISYGDRIGCLLAASLLLGIVNAFIRPVLLLLSLPLILVTLGVFILIGAALDRHRQLTARLGQGRLRRYQPGHRDQAGRPRHVPDRGPRDRRRAVPAQPGRGADSGMTKSSCRNTRDSSHW